MGLIERLGAEVVGSSTPLEPAWIRREVMRRLPDSAPLAGSSEVDVVVESLVGLGPVEHLLADPAVTDVLVNRHDEIWVDRGGRLQRVDTSFAGPEAVRAAIERVITPLGLRIDRASPAVDARLPDGSRFHAAIPPVSVDGPVMAIRRFVPAVRTLDDLREPAVEEVLRDLVTSRTNLLVSGGTGSGKTTLLNLLLAEAHPEERTITVEDSAELSVAGHCLRLEARPANAEGTGEITLQQLVRNALRLRPDRIVVGEVRGPEALDMVSAMNTGHSGSMGTIHANGPSEALWRLETLALSGERRVGRKSVERQIASAVGAVVQVERRGETRLVASVHRFEGGELIEIYRC